MTALYGMCNVPSGVWIDEEGRIVRSPEVAYSKGKQLGSIKMGSDLYADGLRNWVLRGPKSPYVMQREDLLRKLAPKNPKRPLADAHFKLAVHLYQKNKLSLASKHWRQAQLLAPNNWNYHRQEWVFDPATQNTKWKAKYDQLGEQPYYEPADLPQLDEE